MEECGNCAIWKRGRVNVAYQRSHTSRDRDGAMAGSPGAWQVSHLQNNREVTSGLRVSESKSLHAKLIFLEGESIFITKAVFSIVK